MAGCSSASWSPSSDWRWPRCARAIPTAGGLYYWSAKLAKKNGPAWAWFTGWFNLLGQVAITAGIDFGLSAFICAFMGIAFDVEITKVILIGTYTVVLAVHGLLNTFGVRLVAIFNNVSVWWHVAGVAIVVAHVHRPAGQPQLAGHDLQLQRDGDGRRRGRVHQRDRLHRESDPDPGRSPPTCS